MDEETFTCGCCEGEIHVSDFSVRVVACPHCEAEWRLYSDADMGGNWWWALEPAEGYTEEGEYPEGFCDG